MKLIATIALGLIVAGFEQAYAQSADYSANTTSEPLTLAATAPTADWSGQFVGGYLTYGEGSYLQGSDTGRVGVNVDVDGFGLGLRYGQNWQKGTFVFGFDMSVQSGIDGITAQGTGGPNFFCGTGDCNVSINALATIRGRYGMVFGDGKTMAYGAYGLAIGAIDGGIFNARQQGSSTAVGYTAGIGLSRMVTNRISVFGEVNYVDLGDIEFGAASGNETFLGEGDFATVSIGVDYRF